MGSWEGYLKMGKLTAYLYEKGSDPGERWKPIRGGDSGNEWCPWIGKKGWDLGLHCPVWEPQVDSEHLKCDESKVRCTISAKHTRFHGLSMSKWMWNIRGTVTSTCDIMHRVLPTREAQVFGFYWGPLHRRDWSIAHVVDLSVQTPDPGRPKA